MVQLPNRSRHVRTYVCMYSCPRWETVTSSYQLLPGLADGFPLLPALLGGSKPPWSLLVHFGTRGLYCPMTESEDTTESHFNCDCCITEHSSYFLQKSLPAVDMPMDITHIGEFKYKVSVDHINHKHAYYWKFANNNCCVANVVNVWTDAWVHLDRG